MKIWLNILIIICVITAMVLSWLILNLFFTKFFFPNAERLGKSIGTKTNNKVIILIIEILTLLLPFIYIIGQILLYFITNFWKGNFLFYWFISTIIFLGCLFIFSSAFVEYKKLHPDYEPPIISRLKVWTAELKLNRLKRFYLINRIGLLIQQIPDFLKAVTILYLSLILLTSLEWSENFYFLSFCLIPLYANYWVYYIKILTINTNQKEVFVRRAVMYMIMMAFATYELFTRYQDYIYERTGSTDFRVLLLAGSGVLYIALDRILKEVTVDYLNFKKEKQYELAINKRNKL
ncbi:hypothetical protein PAE9249_05170 [Paenibacillus sp. CECT 9249]|uniref:hypothetical protein n=1 Tax=Paenibacillus sp. CECT 9249 TaxID=2845385 RepID=UPI001E62C0C6|nr:hypothetical protein [Paenibacillus sp. CECT 9249]CAH0122598.1 hypothetical protein PAE9249_05170 [Paenibacillus sp. CECT 9249]